MRRRERGPFDYLVFAWTITMVGLAIMYTIAHFGLR